MDAWWWVPIGLLAWFVVAVALALWLGPVLRRCSQALERVDLQVREMPAGLREPPGYERKAS